MKKIKLLMATIIASLIGITLFAQDYNSLLTKAKDFEQNKKYVHALGTYYDAIAAKKSTNNEAYDLYVKLSYTISAGNPGYENFDEFALHDSWLALLTEAEQYWTEHAGEVFSITIEKAKKGDVDYSTRTATYFVPIYIPCPFGPIPEKTFTNKFFCIMKIICEGLKKVWRIDWKDIPEPDGDFNNTQFLVDEDRYPSNWPYASVAKNNIYEDNNIATVKYPNYQKLASWIAGYPIFYRYRNYLSSNARASMINLIVEFVDYNGKSFLKSNWFNVPFINLERDNSILTSEPERYYMILKGVSADTISIIDSGAYDIKIVDSSLSFGCYLKEEESFTASIPSNIDTNSQYFISKMPSKKIPPEQFLLIDSKVSNFKQAQSNSEEKQIAEQNGDLDIFDHVETIKFENWQTKKRMAITICNVSKACFKKITGKNYSKSTANKIANSGIIKIQDKIFRIMDYNFFDENYMLLGGVKEYENYKRNELMSLRLNENSQRPYFYRTDCDSAFLIWNIVELTN